MVRAVRGVDHLVEVRFGDDFVARNAHHGLAGALFEDLVNPLVLLLRGLVPVEVDPLRCDGGLAKAGRLRIDTH